MTVLSGQGAPDTNYGGDALLVVSGGNGWTRRSFVKFDLSTIPAGSIIDSATLRLFLQNAPGSSRTDDVYRVTGADWAEGTITWNNAPAVAATPTDSNATGTTAGAWIDWDVTEDVVAFKAGTYSNYGWRINDNDETVNVVCRYRSKRLSNNPKSGEKERQIEL